MNRREMIFRTGTVAIGLGLAGWTSSVDAKPKVKKVLFFTKSSGYEHSVIKRVDGKPSFAENILSELGPKHGIEFTFSKDGSLFNAEYLAQFDAYFFYTTGDLTSPGTDGNPPMTPEGKAAFLNAIKDGKGFIGTHAASDTFHTDESGLTNVKDRSPRYHNYGENADPYVRMLGAEFIIHGKQQSSKMHIVDSKFPGLKNRSEDFELTEEWYSLKDFADNLHVLLVQETGGMAGEPYERAPYPATWARMHGKGRVFYTSMGHREDVWTNPIFQEILFGGIEWSVRNTGADVKPNIHKVTPQAMDLPPQSKPASGEPKKSVKADKKKV